MELGMEEVDEVGDGGDLDGDRDGGDGLIWCCNLSNAIGLVNGCGGVIYRM